ncbi:hypothetical protein SDC9_138225 [bioreactor metagenome]|uniref:Uncharacterized protein n=1 Tax=bioreactor metagenome TaxID=1076179 RepID=A0A645DPF5_9ZZZZ
MLRRSFVPVDGLFGTMSRRHKQMVGIVFAEQFPESLMVTMRRTIDEFPDFDRRNLFDIELLIQ